MQNNMWRCLRWFYIVIPLILAIACRQEPKNPRPHGYFRIDFPEKKYTQYTSNCHYRFEYPVYGRVVDYAGPGTEPCWINIEFPGFGSKIHITYKNVDKNLMSLTEDIRTLAYKHIIKADDIVELPVTYPEKKVYGMIYDIKGNTASSVNFYLTDSSRQFLSGALYFNALPNKDSLAPVISFFHRDIEHLIETFHWE
ncbi:MAG: gliding motility lipoprotein GldD [Bacteroidales bacterium]|nr:gliding motility lipoprotein GldD [Bacteroidales bacterium]